MTNARGDPALYNYQRRPVDYRIIALEKLSWAHRLELSFPTNFPTDYTENNAVYAEYYWPLVRDGGRPVQPRPLVLFLHGWSGNMFFGRHFAREFARWGIATMLLFQPFHRRRTPPVLRRTGGFLAAADQALKVFQLSVIDARTALDLALDFSNVDPERVAIGGVSLGSLVAALTLAVDERIKGGFLMLGGGNLPLIVGQSVLTGRLRRRALAKELRQEVRGSLAARELPAQLKEGQTIYEFLRRLQEKGLKAFAAAPETAAFEPLNYADLIRARPLVMINAKFDRVMPAAATRQLWEALGRPPLYSYPTGHFTLAIFYRFFSRRIQDFLLELLGRPASTPC